MKVKRHRKQILECITAVNFKSSNHTIIVDAEFLVLACASNLPQLAHRPTPPALAVDMCNLGAR